MAMKNMATIFLLVLMVSIQTPFGQLFKMPLLVEHYLIHQEQDDDSLVDFLEEHYVTNHNDADLPEDEQLPFKSITFYSIGYAIVTHQIQPNVALPLSVEKKFFFPVTYTLQQHLASIFHPPKA